jgi:hypothetical protein
MKVVGHDTWVVRIPYEEHRAATDIVLQLNTVLERSFTQAGFAEVAIERQTLTFEYPSLEEFIEERPATSASIRIMLAEASAAQPETIWRMVAQAMGKYQDATGVLRIPTEALCVVGKA